MSKRRARILMVSAEVESLARTGGLGDVVEALSRVLSAGGADVVIVTPRYGSTRVPVGAAMWSNPVPAPVGPPGAEGVRHVGVIEGRLASHRGSVAACPRVCLITDEALFARPGIYGDNAGVFGDNAFRFATLSAAALSVAERAWDGLLPDIVHAHDWHAALSVIYAKLTRGQSWAAVPTVFTIHSLAYQGVIGSSEVERLSIPTDAWSEGWIRHDGSVNLVKGGIEIADRVTTVSETYAREIQTQGHGCGLDAHLRWHSKKLTGIVNGIDTESFDPATDGAIACGYGVGDASQGKRACKSALLRELALDDDETAPLFALVSRLQPTKGIDLLLSALPALVGRGGRLALVGTGDPAIEAAVRAATARFPGRVSARLVFDPRLARRVFAGADFLVVPSRDEPCGLTQLYAMRYGAIPIVTPVGGLRDTVDPVSIPHGVGTGFVSEGVDAASLLVALEDALGMWGDRMGRAEVITRAMMRESAWAFPALRYTSLYDGMVER